MKESAGISEETDRMINILLKAKKSKKEILAKLKMKLSQEEMEKAEKYIGSHNRKILRRSIGSVFNIFIGLTIVFTIIGIAGYYYFIENNSFTSEKCDATISITGDPWQRADIIKALELVEKDCRYFTFVHEFAPVLEAGKLNFFDAGYYYQDNARVVIDTTKTSIYYTASIIVHEACHGYQDRVGKPMSEGECTTTQYNFLKNIGAPQSHLDKVEVLGKQNPVYRMSGEDAFEEWRNK